MIRLKQNIGRLDIGNGITITLATPEKEIKRYLKTNPRLERFFEETKTKKDGKANKGEELAKSKSKGSDN